MASIENAKTSDYGFSIADEVGWFYGIADPAVNNEVAPRGSIYCRKPASADAELWLKYGDANNEWIKYATTPNGGVDAQAIHDNEAAEITAIAEKTTPAPADVLIIEDSAAADVKKKLQIANLPVTIQMSAGRNNSNVTNSFLWGMGGSPTNETPYIMPFNATLIFMSASTAVSESWTAEIYQNGALLTGATLVLTAVDNLYAAKSIDVNIGDKISMRCNGSGIDHPGIVAIFRSR